MPAATAEAPQGLEAAGAARTRDAALLQARLLIAQAGVGEVAELPEEAMPVRSAGSGDGTVTSLLRPKKERTAIGMLMDLQKQILNEGGAGGDGEGDENDEEWDKAVAAAMRENPAEMMKLMREGSIDLGKPRARDKSEGRERSASSARRRRREEQRGGG